MTKEIIFTLLQKQKLLAIQIGSDWSSRRSEKKKRDYMNFNSSQYLQRVLLCLAISVSACHYGTPKKTKYVEHRGSGYLVITLVDPERYSALYNTKNEKCHLQKKLANFIDEFAAKHYAQILTNTDLATVPANTQILQLAITEITGVEESSWTGTKSVSIKGNLTKNGLLMGDFKGRRIVDSSMFNLAKGSCAVLLGSLKLLGKDVAKWLKRPTKDAQLGDF